MYIRLKIEQLPEGMFLATSEDVQGLLAAQGATIEETIDIAKDIARQLLLLQKKSSSIFNINNFVKIPEHAYFLLPV